MKRILMLGFVILLLGLPGRSGISAEEENDPHKAGPNRMDLVIPYEIWGQVLKNVGFGDGPLGYSADTMSHFKGSDHILRSVEGLFRDITHTPRFAGRMGDQLLADPANFANAAAVSFRILDAYGGRHITAPGPDSWGVEWIEDDESITDAHEKVNWEFGASVPNPPEDYNMAQWDKLPDEIKRLVVLIFVGAAEFTPFLREAVDEDFLTEFFDVESIDEITMEQLYELASAPWVDDEEDEYSLTPRESFEALDRFDMDFHATGAKGFLTFVHAAIEEFRAVENIDYGDFERCEFQTRMGRMAIFGTGTDIIEGDFSLIIDLGGNDIYTGRTAVPRSLKQPISVVIDLGGDDEYACDEYPVSLACGNHGIGAIFDLDGDDVYRSDESGIGCAWYGTGLVVDYAGDDLYASEKWGQGAAHVGLGMLIDVEGNDVYKCITQSQAFGATLGVGVLVDGSGDDVYFADPEGNISEMFEGRSLSLAQGFGYGRRADFGDGHSLGGGVGFLVDGAGDDQYTGSVYTQGAAYWWALGCLEDRRGNDTYTNEQYSCGSAPHFGIGCLVDLAGDDRYNIGNDDMERQLQAHARDGSFGIFIDGSGDDEYQLDNLCAGSSDLNSLTLFWDRMGNDIYIADRRTPRKNAHSFGGVTNYGRFNTFRDETPSVGIFLDTAGYDTYDYILPDDSETAANLIPLQFANDTEWFHDNRKMFMGYGWDVGWYEGMGEEEKP